MLQIPNHILEKLKCVLCGGFLSVTPVVVRDNQQICGKCFRLLPLDERNRCQEQISYVILGDVFAFPCRYHNLGCQFTYSMNCENGHEVVCTYRYSSTPDPFETYINVQQNNGEGKCETEKMQAHLSYEITECKYSRDLKRLTYSINVQGNNGKNISIVDKNTNQRDDNVSLHITGALSLSKPPQFLYSDIKVKQLNENIYDTLNYHPLICCVNCKCLIQNKPHKCVFNHASCSTCKENMCAACLNQSDMKSLCKNYEKGCQDKLEQFDRNKHEINCDFNEVNCPIEACKVSDILQNIKTHLKQSHSDAMWFSAELTKQFGTKDETVIFYCYDNIFKCVYYYYKSFVELYVMRLGPGDKLTHYFLEVSVQANENVIKKRCKCSNWNNVLLEKGIIFDKKDIANKEKKLNAVLHLRIIHSE